MDNSEKERFPTAYALECMVWRGNDGFEEGFLCDGFPDMGAIFVFKVGMKLAIYSCCGWRDVVRSRYLMMMETV